MTRWLLNFKFRRETLAVATRFFGVFLLVAMPVYYGIARKTSVSVSASTEFLAVETTGGDEIEWDLAKLEACVRTDTPSAQSESVKDCAPSLYEGRKLEDAVLRWPVGYHLEFRAYEPTYLEVHVTRTEGAATVLLDGTLEVESGTLLRIPFQDQRPVLPVRGHVSIGNVPNRADSFILIQGEYEIREKPLLGDAPIVVIEDSLFPGDRIDMTCKRPVFRSRSEGVRCSENHDPAVDLFVTNLDPRTPEFDVVAGSRADFSNLRLTRAGGLTTDIRVSPIRRIITDPLPLAAATLLGLVGTIIALSNAYLSSPREKRPGNRES